MRGYQLGWQWRTIRAIGTSSNGLTVAEIAKREEIGIRTIYRDLDALQGVGVHLDAERAEWNNRWAFIDMFIFKIPPPFTPSEFVFLCFYKDLIDKWVRAGAWVR